MLYNVLLIVQILVALSIIGLVLIQHGKGADAGAAFGGGASGTVFGSRGSGNFLSRTTAILAAIFFANSLALAWLVSNRNIVANTDSVVPAAVTESVETTAPVVPSDVPSATGSEATPASSAAPADVPVTEDSTPTEGSTSTIPADVPNN